MKKNKKCPISGYKSLKQRTKRGLTTPPTPRYDDDITPEQITALKAFVGQFDMTDMVEDTYNEQGNTREILSS